MINANGVFIILILFTSDFLVGPASPRSFDSACGCAQDDNAILFGVKNVNRIPY